MAQKCFLEEALLQNPILRDSIRPGLIMTELETELGLDSMQQSARAVMALIQDLDQDGMLRLMFLLAERLTPEETRTAPTPADRACVQLLRTACWLPPGHLMMLVRDLVLYELMRRRGSSAL